MCTYVLTLSVMYETGGVGGWLLHKGSGDETRKRIGSSVSSRFVLPFLLVEVDGLVKQLSEFITDETEMDSLRGV